jgi:hypothetical protein
VRTSVTAGREIIVGSVLILIGRPLVAVTRSLVVIRPGLILVARGLVTIRRLLSPVTLDLVAFRPRAMLIRQEVGRAGWAPGRVDHVAAGRTPHNFGHLVSLPERAGRRTIAASRRSAAPQGQR